MSNKVKMKCAVCHKSFKSSKATQTLCEDCERKRRLEKVATTPAQAMPQPTATPTGVKPVWLEKAILREVKAPVTTPTREPQPPRAPTTPHSAAPKPVLTQPEPEPAAKAPATAPKKPAKAPSQDAPKTPRSPKEHGKYAPPTAEQTVAIEQRYLALARPEFDGIRTQIAEELRLPKSVVKHVVTALRARQHLPSWWEMQNFAGTPADMEHIRAAYTAYLPTPPLGIHKQIAQDLQLPPSQVYHAIRNIRLSLGMTVFNPREQHTDLQTEPSLA